MRKKGLFPFLIGLVTFSFQVAAQDDVTPQISNLYVYWHKPDKQISVDPTAYDFKQHLEQNLSAEGVTVHWIEDNETPPQIDIAVTFDEKNLYFMPIGSRRLYVTKLLSPILSDRPSTVVIPLKFPFRYDQDQDFLELFTGISLYEINRCDLAIDHFNASVQNASSNDNTFDSSELWTWEAKFYEANCHILDHNYAKAIEILEQLATTWDIPSTVNLAWVYLENGENKKAFALMDDLADEVVPLNYLPFVLSKRGQLYGLAGKYDDAISDFTAAIDKSLVPSPDIYLLRGKMYLAQYEWDSALADYNVAIELDPTYADAYYERGVLYYSILQTGVELRTEAFDDFHRYLELAPDGDHAADAARYTAQIQKELEALNG